MKGLRALGLSLFSLSVIALGLGGYYFIQKSEKPVEVDKRYILDEREDVYFWDEVGERNLKEMNRFYRCLNMNRDRMTLIDRGNDGSLDEVHYVNCAGWVGFDNLGDGDKRYDGIFDNVRERVRMVETLERTRRVEPQEIP